jgi:hypothetical protein
MSSYGKLSTKLSEAEDILRDNGIRCEVIDYKTWYKSSEIRPFNETGAALRKKFNCCMQGCGLLYWCGKLFYCATLPFLIEVNAFPKSSENYYDIRNETIDRVRLLDEICVYADRANTDRFIDACRYCSGKTSSNFEHSVPVAEQVKGIIKIPDIYAG